MTRIKSAFSAIGLGYLVLLITTSAFLAVSLCFERAETSLNPDHIDVKPIEGVAWIDWEKSYVATITGAGLTIDVEDKWYTAMTYNFSMIPIEVTVTNVGNVTYPDFRVQLLIEDDTGQIRGTGVDSPRVSSTGERQTRSVFLFNVPEDLRGQELKVHIIPTIQQQTLVIGKPPLLFVRTFPSAEQREVPRMLLFFLAFSTLPVSAFLPTPLKNRLEECWRGKLEKNSGAVALTIVLFVFGSLLYWDIVCRVFCFL